MLADPLTKPMGAERMVETFVTGVFDMQPTAESLQIKAKNRAARKVVRGAKNPLRDVTAMACSTDNRCS